MNDVRALESRIASLERQLTQLMRQMRGGFALSRSTAPSQDGGPVQTNQGRLDALSLKDGMPTLYTYGFSSSLPIGGDKLVAFMYGDRSQGVVMATGHQTYRFTGLVTGEAVMHDMWGRSVKMSATGIVVQGGSLDITLITTSKVRVEAPMLECTGDIWDNCDTQPHSAASFRTIYDSHEHQVRNVQAGGATVTTEIPNQQD